MSENKSDYSRRKYSITDVQRSLDFKMPKFLFDKEFKSLSNDARVLYCLLKDRLEESICSNNFNVNNNVYIIFTREEMQLMLNISGKKVTSAMRELKEYKLIKEIRQGLGKPNKIYIFSI